MDVPNAAVRRRGLLLDPRTKLLMLVTVTSLMLSTGNSGVTNIVKPVLSILPFILLLSGGEKQKIACASAFMMEPQVFVLDEPSSNLDADAILDLREVIAYLKSLGKTVVLSEHRLYYLRGIADRYLYMSGGRICGDYTSAQFAQLPNEERKRMGLRALSLDALTAASSSAASCCKPRKCSNSCAEAAALPTLLRTIRS